VTEISVRIGSRGRFHFTLTGRRDASRLLRARVERRSARGSLACTEGATRWPPSPSLQRQHQDAAGLGATRPPPHARPGQRSLGGLG
jgi:hypothetical protein